LRNCKSSCFFHSVNIQKSVCSQLVVDVRTKLLSSYAELCCIPNAHNPTSGARVVLVRALGRSSICKLFESWLTSYHAPCKVVGRRPEF
jgi:hypothetical protein